MRAIRSFWHYFIGSWIIFIVLLPIVNIFKIYEVIPAIGVIGYGAMILLNLIAITHAVYRYDYILLSIALIAIGLIASVDIISNKQQMIAIWTAQSNNLTLGTAEDYVQVIIILLNIFTSGTASQCLFYGLNKRAYDR